MPSPFSLPVLRLRHPAKTHSAEDDSDRSSPDHPHPPGLGLAPPAVVPPEHECPPSLRVSSLAVPPLSSPAAPSANPTASHKKPNLLRRVSSKLQIAIPVRLISLSSPSQQNSRSPFTPLPSPLSPHSPRSQHPSSTLPRPSRSRSFLALPKSPPPATNGFLSQAHREAALRDYGLRPLRKDLSQQEHEEDAHIPVLAAPEPSPSMAANQHMSLAQTIRQEWIAQNTSRKGKLKQDQAGDPESVCDFPVYSPSVSAQKPASAPLFPVMKREYLASRHALGTHLEEDDSANHSDGDDDDILPSPSHPDFVSCPPPRPRRDLPHRSTSAHSAPRAPHPLVRLRRSMSTSLRTLSMSPGTRSAVSILGRSSADGGERSRSRSGSGSRSGSSEMNAGDSTRLTWIRTPVTPTMHNRASILFETKAVEDPESRRLCEVAFLD